MSGLLTAEELLKLGPTQDRLVRLDIGCGARKKAGFIGVDSQLLPGVDIIHDIEQPMPIGDGVVDEIYSNFAFEHVSNFPALMKEIYRICRPGAKIVFRVPWYQSYTQFKDPTHKSFILPETIAYFGADTSWYGSNYNLDSNFQLIRSTHHYLPPFHYFANPKLGFINWIFEPFLSVARRFLWNVVHSVTLEIRKV
jgi:SAM-dependent methyltransferase